MSFILGSQSSRRAEILRFFNLPFSQFASHFDEESIQFLGNPEKYVTELSRNKALLLAAQFPDSIILTADTIVHKEGKIYNKPQDRKEAFQYLKELSGEWHNVFTGLTLYSQKRFFHQVEETKVLFHSLTDEQIQLYHQHLDFMDKAGGYMIQGAGSLVVKQIDGCYYNVMGLPVNALCTLLRQIGIDLWHHLQQAPS